MTAYETLLRLYPRNYREEFGGEMLDVLLQAEGDAARNGVLVRAWFLMHESMGLLAGAARERLHALGEERGWKFLAERGPMFRRERRYPYSSIVLMTFVLGLIVLVIAKAQGVAYYVTQIQAQGQALQSKDLVGWPSHWGLLASIALFFAMTWLAAIAAWGVSHSLRRSGVHRLDEAQTWPQAR